MNAASVRRSLAAVAVAGLLGSTGAGVLAPAAGAADAVPETAKTRFIKQADAICDAGRNRLRDKVEGYESRKQGGSTATRKVATPSDVARFVRDVAADEISSQITALAALKPPTGDAAEFKKILAAARTALAAVRKNPQNAAFDNPFAAVGKSFAAYGITSCASNDLPDAPTAAQ